MVAGQTICLASIPDLLACEVELERGDAAGQLAGVDVWDAQHIGAAWVGRAWLGGDVGHKATVMRQDGADAWEVIHIGPRVDLWQSCLRDWPGKRGLGSPPRGLRYEEAMTVFDSLPN